MKKLLCTLCLVFFLTSCLLCAANGEGGNFSTADGYEYAVREDGTAIVMKYPVIGGVVSIPGELDGVPVTAVGQMEFADENDRKQIRKVTVAEGVLSLEQDAFNGFTELFTVTLPDSLAAIGERAFYSCKKLKYFRMPAGLKTIGEEAFYACGLTSVAFPDGLEAIGRRAFDCGKCRDLTFPASLRNIGDEAFRADGRQQLKKVTFLGEDTIIGDRVFGYIYTGDGKTLGSYTEPLPSALKIPVLTVACLPGSTADQRLQFNVKKQYPKWDASHIRTAPADRVIEAGLYGAADQVYELTIPEGVEEIGDNAFADLKTLTRVSLPSTLKVIGKNAFSGCFALTAAALPENLTLLGEGCFRGCSSLKEVSIPAGVEEIPKEAFSGCFRLEKLSLPEGLKTIGEEAFSQDSETVEFIYTAYDADDHFAALKKLELPAGLQTVGRAAFENNDGLTSVTFAKESRLTCLENFAFSGCVRLKKLILPDGLKSIGEGAFMNDHSLASLDIPDSVTEIGESMLEGCPLSITVTCGRSSTMAFYIKRYENIQAQYRK